MHPYLRAYMAGVAFPTMLIPLALVAIAVHEPVHHPFHLEDIAIFPIGLVPNAWGLWNILYSVVRRRWSIPIGAFGASLVFLLAPLGYSLQVALGTVVWTPALLAVGLPVTVALYYIAWRHVVARYNEILGIA